MTHDRPGEIIPDGHAGAIVMLDGQPQSHVNVTDPTDLGFEYVELMATALETYAVGLAPTRSRLRTHTCTPHRPVDEKSSIGTGATSR